jgi:hypothetical protein
MATPILIQDIARYDGQDVTVRGWLYDKTHKGKLAFLKVRDGSGIAQCVAFQKEMDPAQFETAIALSQESSLIVSGVVRKDDRAPGYPGGYEIGIRSLEVIQAADEYPITPKEHGTEFLMDHRHLWLRSTRQWAILRIRATIIKAIRDWLDDHGYLLVDTPILTPAAGENTTTLFQIDYFGEPAFLAQTGQLYNEANMAAHGKVYCFGPTFRAEKSKTRRHLMEFWMVEPEMAFFDLDALIDGAISGGKKPTPKKVAAAPAGGGGANLPDTLSRAEIQGGMRKIKDRVQGCYDKFRVPGTAFVQVTISPSGTISAAKVKGMFAGTPTGACLQAAARAATFPRFRGQPITIDYPFILR